MSGETTKRRRRPRRWPLDDRMRARIERVRPTIEQQLYWMDGLTEDHLARYILHRGLLAIEAQQASEPVPVAVTAAGWALEQGHEQEGGHDPFGGGR